MPRFGTRYLLFNLALVMGTLLGVLLLVQSAVNYYQVSRIMVIAELRREAQRQVNSIAREAVQLGVQDSARLQPVFDGVRQEAPDKIAWIRLIGRDGGVLVQSGAPVGPPGAIPRPPEEIEAGRPAADIRTTAEGRVLVTVTPLRIRRAFGEPGSRPPDQPAAQGETPPAQRDQQTGQPPGPGFRGGPRYVEVALYFSSASATFGPLVRNLVVSSLAALGLVASMVLLWLRFPHYVRGKQLEQQTELARKVQSDLLPPPNLTLPNLDFAAECVPAYQVGGDFYDVFTARDGRVAMALGDVSGKGLPASVVAGLLLGAVRSSDWMSGAGPHEAASAQLSELLRTRTSAERFASLFWCYYDPAARRLHYVNAGHLPPMLATRNGDRSFDVHRLEEGGPILGVLPNVAYRQGSTAVSDDGLIVLYSDGVVEAENSAGELYGEERLQAAIAANAHRPSHEIRDEILGDVQQFLGKARAQDDLTLVVARLRSG
ncbi:MAG: PP2C family protein-serine/threonine phosphatase [Acidobacteria bacterium]|nr:PP2C family protein-serine/threonine phosphatase [Acidobacteriota bacterium]